MASPPPTGNSEFPVERRSIWKAIAIRVGPLFIIFTILLGTYLASVIWRW